MKIYTRTGDTGETALLGGVRASKDDIRIEAYGTVDELNASLGAARAELVRSERLAESVAESIDAILAEAQNRLFDLGAELATATGATISFATLSEPHVAALEGSIDHHESSLPPLREFVLPGGSAAASHLHLARCVCRRAERTVVRLAGEQAVREIAVRYLNRLSDLLFVLARAANHGQGVTDTPWRKAAESP
ncbi:cob(I)yrinic acid a,c-diamide adenosyltransferase [Botrimarina hoheduenensis]|uniref:Corrinoid adenosyltransferase n=1 Tax=Botrimarina hoheduenensis TaxID=2528000 RepID=A0A5C5W041_9BACT|nr:cob(I)yrinic acid a,c-diamide adenosyltransferase [Botrimarina hoheduenensis]TWT43419.1 Cob(I)yrinic acid a,c-diamide adenosyltransferase [Botrimarina hoheduenensis]